MMTGFSNIGGSCEIALHVCYCPVRVTQRIAKTKPKSVVEWLVLLYCISYLAVVCAAADCFGGAAAEWGENASSDPRVLPIEILSTLYYFNYIQTTKVIPLFNCFCNSSPKT